MIIDLGGGRRPKAGYLSVDLVNADIICNIEEGLPFKDGEIERIYTHHCLEHLMEDKIVPVLKDCFRVLEDDAEFEVTVPDFNDAILRFRLFEDGVNNGEWHGMIFGSNSDDFQDRHYTIFTEKKLKSQLEEAGFVVGEFDYPLWYGGNLHVIAKKVVL